MALTTPINAADAVVIRSGIKIGFDAATKVAQLSTQEFTGDILGVGSTVKVNSIVDPTITAYEPGTPLVREAVAVTSSLLTVDQADYVNFDVDDTAIAAGSGGFLGAASTKAGRKFARKFDRHIASVWAAGAGITAGLGTTGTPIDLSAAGAAYEYFVALRTALADTGEDLVAVVPSAVYGLLLLDSHFVGAGSQVQYNGQVGSAAGITVVEANVIDPATGKYTILASSDRGAVASAMTINKFVSYIPEDAFSEAVKGLAVYGAAVMVAGQAAKGVVTV